MIVKNEQDYVKECLQTTLPVVDEVVIVDSGSTDKTKEIIEQMNQTYPNMIRVFDRAWPDDFANQRNYALQQAKSDWIIVLDADERLTKDHYETIRKAIEAKDVDAYLIPIRNYTQQVTEFGYQPSRSKEYPYGFIVTHLNRLFRNHKNFQYEGILHERVEPSLKKALATSRPLEIVIHHLGKIKEKENHLEASRYAFYEELAQKKVNAYPNDAQAHWELGVIFQKQGRAADAEKAFDKALKLSPDSEEIELYYLLSLFQQSQWDKILAYSPKHTKSNFFITLAQAQTDASSVKELDQFRSDFAQAALFIFELSLKHGLKDRIDQDRTMAQKTYGTTGILEFLEASYLRGRGDMAAAERMLRVSLQKKCKLASTELLILLAQQGQFKELLTEYKRLQQDKLIEPSPELQTVIKLAEVKMAG